MSRYDLTVLRSRADGVTLRPGTVVPMPTSPRAEQSRTHGPVPGMPPGAKDHRRPTRAGLGEENCAGCCLWPSGPAFAPCPPAVAYFEVSKDPASGARSEGGRSVVLWEPRSSSPSDCAPLQRPGHHHPVSLAAASGTDGRVRHHIQRDRQAASRPIVSQAVLTGK